jgi:cytochrome c oxidase subunit II
MFLASKDIVGKVDEAFLWIGGISLVLLVGITGAMIVFLFRYRRDRHPKAAQIEGNTPLEITWIVIPTFIVLFMFYKGYEGFLLMRNPPPDAKVIEVEARQWAWTFRYPDEGISAPELYVPVNTPIKLLLTAPADDVVHSFYLPAFRVKEDCVPGRENHLWFEADKVSTYNIFCAEFCGKDHARMLSLLHVLSAEDYDAWVDRMIAEKNKPVDAALAADPASEEIRSRDALVLYQTYCASCHGSEGQGGLVEGARDMRDPKGWKRGPKVTDIFRTLTLGLEGTQMRSFANLSAWDRFALSHHVKELRRGEGWPEDATLEEYQALVKEYKLDEQPVVRRDFPIEETMEEMAGETERESDGNDRR